MSVRVMALAWEHSQHAGSELLMLLAIADFADDNGRAYPSISTLAKKCRTSPRYVIKLLDALVASRELEIVKNAGVMGRGGRTNLYRVRLCESAAQQAKPVNRGAPVHQGALVNSGTGTSEPGDNEVVHQGSPKPSENHHEPPVGAAAPSRGRRKSEKKTFREWYETTKAANPKVLDDEDPTYAYLEKIGLSHDFMLVHWHWFKAKHLESGTRQADWPQTFRNSVKGNYGRLWWRSDDGCWRLTTAGKQAALDQDRDPNMTSGGSDRDPWAGAT